MDASELRARYLALPGATAEHQWIVEVALTARLSPVGSSPLFLDGWERPPSLWLPSGIYF